MVQRFGRTSRRLHLLQDFIALSLVALVAFVGFEPAQAITPEPGSIDKLLTVDCLLPGQVHRLGTQMTFLSARHAVKTSAGDCEIRGGEYVAYDRANYFSALKVWLPLASEGDKAAQTYVGEIYEKGLGTTPDYAAAAQWYRKAAEQGYARAQINLGFLYERGLGVPKDPRQALEWYRKSAGLQGAIALDDGSQAARDAELQSLRRELETTRRELDKARQELEQERRRTQSELEQLRRQQQAAASKGDSAEAKRLAGLLTARDDELRRKQEQVERLERASGDFRFQITSLERESAALKGELGALKTLLDKANAELTERRAQAGADQQRVEALRKELARYRDQAAQSADRTQVAKLEAEIKQREADIKQREAELGRKQEDIARLEQDAQKSREQLVKVEAAQKAAETAATRKDTMVAIAPPSIQLIDPAVVLTRTVATVPLRGNVTARDLVGRVTAPAGLFSLSVNDQSLTPDELGMFRTQVPITRGQTPVSIIAIDRQGKRALLEFTLVADPATSGAPRPPRVAITGEFGKYYALVIGNEHYQRLPRLDTAAEDARAVAEALKKHYGFDVTLLTDATRYQMMTAINQLTEKLTEKDNLLIYYAGHGELDRTNLRAHWLPTDAEPNSDANWVSTAFITDHLNRMAANHVLIVADSCYAGAMTRSSIGQLETGVSDEARLNQLKVLVKSRSRTALTSGGVQPVIDGGGGGHSVFAKVFLQILNENQDVLEARRLYLELSARVITDALKFKYEQKPEYAPIQYTGHEAGDFVFVPVN